MANHYVLAEVLLPHVSGLPEDVDVNTFAFVGDRATDVDVAADVAGANLIDHFYNSANTTNPVSGYLSLHISRVANAATINYYALSGHLDGSPHGSPIRVDHFTVGAGGGGADAVPAECGVVITLAGAGRDAAPVELPGPPETRPKARHTGRIYIGPVLSMVYGAVSNENRVQPAVAADLAQAAARLVTQSNALGALAWAVWSRKNAAMDPVAGGWVDNAPDIQRRRGVRSTARVTF